MANLKTNEKKTKAQSMGMHSEVLTGRTQQKFFNPDEAENFYYFGTYDVDFNKRTDLDVKDMSAPRSTHVFYIKICPFVEINIISSKIIEVFSLIRVKKFLLSSSC